VVQERQIGGLSQCENLLAFERDKCLQDQQSAAAGGTRAPAATGATTPQAPATVPQAPTMAPQAPTTAPQTPAGTVR
jgi:hypothetical protein